MHCCDYVPVCSIITLSLHVSEANIRRPHIRRPKRTRTCAKTHTPDASGARSLIHLPKEPGPTCMTRGLGSGNDAVASWLQGPRSDNSWPVEEPRGLVVGSRLGLGPSSPPLPSPTQIRVQDWRALGPSHHVLLPREACIVSGSF